MCQVRKLQQVRLNGRQIPRRPNQTAGGLHLPAGGKCGLMRPAPTPLLEQQRWPADAFRLELDAQFHLLGNRDQRNATARPAVFAGEPEVFFDRAFAVFLAISREG